MTGEETERPFFRRWLLLGGLATALTVLGAVLLLTRIPSLPDGVTADEWAFCTQGTSGHGGPEIVDEAAITYLGWDGESGWDRDGTACRIGYELYGLNQAEWDWCYDGSNRAALLEPAVALLGMGEDEANGSDGFGEAPGDDPAEYAQACRLVYQHWREQGAVSEIADPLAHPFLALTADQQAWCGAAENRDVVEWAAMRLGIETPARAPQVHQVTAYVRSCRIASLAERVPAADAPTVHVQDERAVFSAEVRARAEADLAEIERSTGFVAVFVTERSTNADTLGIGMPAAAEDDGYLELRLATEALDGCCAATYHSGGPGPFECCPFVDDLIPHFSAGRTDEGLRAFVTLVENLAGDPEPPPRRLPANLFAEP